MTDEFSEHMRLSLMVWMTGAFLGVVVGVVIFSLLVMNQRTDKYSTAMVQATTSGLYDLAVESQVSCPSVYSAISASASEINRVYVKWHGSSNYVILYDYMNNTDSLITLMTGMNATKNVRITLTQNKNLLDVYLEEVVQ